MPIPNANSTAVLTPTATGGQAYLEDPATPGVPRLFENAEKAAEAAEGIQGASVVAVKVEPNNANTAGGNTPA